MHVRCIQSQKRVLQNWSCRLLLSLQDLLTDALCLYLWRSVGRRACGISRNQTQVSECKHLYLLNRVTEPTLLFLEDIQESQNPEEGFHRPENAKWNFRKSEAEPRPTAARRRACAAASETLQAQFSFWVSSYLKTQSGVSGSPEGSPGRAAIRNGARARARARTRPSHPEPEVGAIAAWGLAWPGRRQRRPSWLPAERQCEGKKL
ncbi:uncharacterized protein LOC127697741 isoform X3 [Apodemus sylvaticus]|uniref:uncharacterized protein LOC127697741 isoform X3 n=1 Tax=Apodemus sylvaticus TaxID=10129 RepID=UPI002244D4FD|nr:uncharacterized protein LOC127697741 isoform X3 [Apodemus sylvaticus]XP_052056997.1 uncharacterized protein LOC127697741 isoform X3 [Apodemus sylvaticus]